jgi:hypothetical protein
MGQSLWLQHGTGSVGRLVGGVETQVCYFVMTESCPRLACICLSLPSGRASFGIRCRGEAPLPRAPYPLCPSGGP